MPAMPNRRSLVVASLAVLATSGAGVIGLALARAHLPWQTHVHK